MSTPFSTILWTLKVTKLGFYISTKYPSIQANAPILYRLLLSQYTGLVFDFFKKKNLKTDHTVEVYHTL